MADSDSDEEGKIEYDKEYVKKFSRKIPFPRLEIENIQINPVHTEYFYITKTQAIDENFKIQNYVSTEDINRIQQLVEDSRAKLGQESDEDSDGENKRDLFEEALEHMRENKEYNIDEDGMTKPTQGVTIVTRGTRTSGDVKDIGSIAKAKVGGGFDGRNPQESAIIEESGEQTSEIESETPEDDEEDNDEDDEDEEGGEDDNEEEEQEDESEKEENSEESKKEESKEVEKRTATKKKTGLIPGLGEGGPLETAAEILNIPQNVQSEEEAKKKIDDMIQQAKLDMEQEIIKRSGVNVDKLKKEGENEENEEEEKYTEEYVQFQPYEVENSGRTLRSKPLVLILCKLETFGYTVQHKIYSESKIDEESFKFSKTKYFSSCGNYFLTKFNKTCVIYNAMTLEEKYRYQLDENAEDSYGTQIWLSFDAKYLCYRNSNSYSFFDGRNGEFQHTHEENLYQYMKFINSNELIGYCHDVTTGFSKLGKYNARNQESSEIASLNKYYPTISNNFYKIEKLC